MQGQPDPLLFSNSNRYFILFSSRSPRWNGRDVQLRRYNSTKTYEVIPHVHIVRALTEPAHILEKVDGIIYDQTWF